MSWFRRTREVLIVKMPDGRFSAQVGDSAGEVTWRDGDTPEEALEALRISLQYADASRPQKVKVNW